MQKGEVLGEGTYGRIYTAKSSDGKEMAFKRFILEPESEGICNLKEIDILTKIKGHKNIISIEEVTYDTPFIEPLSPLAGENKERKDSNVNILLEKTDHGDLESLSKNVSFRYKYQMMVDCIQALLYLKKNKILHRDIKPSNILLFNDGDDTYTTKITDFGLSKYFTLSEISTPEAATWNYKAPELCLGLDYDYSIDIWGMGLVFFFLVSGKNWIRSSKDTTTGAVINHIIRLHPEDVMGDFRTLLSASGKKDEIVITDTTLEAKKVSFLTQLKLPEKKEKRFLKRTGHSIKEFEDVLINMLKFNPNDRIKIEDIPGLPFFSNIKFKEERLISYSIKYSCYMSAYRSKTMSIITTMYSDRRSKKLDDNISAWVSDRVLFHTMRIYDLYSDEYVLETQKMSDMVLYYILFLCIKFFNSVYLSPKIEQIIPKEFIPEIKHIEIFERRIYQKLLKNNFYYETVYEELDGEIYKDTISQLITIFASCVWMNGLTPERIIKKYKKYGYEKCLTL